MKAWTAVVAIGLISSAFACSSSSTGTVNTGGGGSGTGTGTGQGTSGGSGCSGLSTCCDSSSFPSAEAPGCKEIVAEGNASDCTSTLESFQEINYCSGGSTGSSGTGSSGGGCSELSSCCNSLDSTESPGCKDVASAGVAADCSAALEEYMAAQQCN